MRLHSDILLLKIARQSVKLFARKLSAGYLNSISDKLLNNYEKLININTLLVSKI